MSQTMTILVLHNDQSWLLLTLGELKSTISQPIQFEHCPHSLIPTVPTQNKYDLIVCGVSKEDTALFQQLEETHLKSMPILFISDSNDPSLFFQSTRFTYSSFIVWPFQPLNLLVSMYQLCPEIISPKQAPLTLKGPRSERIRVPKTTIQFIHSEGNYCFIYTGTHRFALKCSLKKMLEKLDGTFLQVHKRYCINTQSILRIDWTSQQIYLRDNLTVPFGRNYRKEMLIWAGKSKQYSIKPDLYTNKVAEA